MDEWKGVSGCVDVLDGCGGVLDGCGGVLDGCGGVLDGCGGVLVGVLGRDVGGGVVWVSKLFFMNKESLYTHPPINHPSTKPPTHETSNSSFNYPTISTPIQQTPTNLPCLCQTQSTDSRGGWSP